MKPDTKRIQLGEAEIYYEVIGEGPPLVLVHGLSGSTRWWRRNIGPFAEKHRVYVVDLIGFGGSRGRQTFVLSEAGDFLVRWMDHLGMDRASFVGHSMGGFISADLAAHYPDRLDRLVLVDAVAIPLQRGHVGNAIGLVRALRYARLSFWPVLFTDALRAGPAVLVNAARELLTTSIVDKLGEIGAPTLVVWGEKDRLVPPSVGEELMKHLPHGDFVLVEGAGHNPMWDRPEVFNRVVIAFLDRRSSIDRDQARDSRRS